MARTLRATELLVRDQRVSRPLRWLAAVALLPIPGPFDEAVLLIVGPLLWVFHREPMRAAWRSAGRKTARDERERHIAGVPWD
jgi:hypothetical protein